MESLDEIINESKDPREVKRALSVKMALSGMPSAQISSILNLSPQYLSKWRIRYEAQGAASLLLAYQGSQSYLSSAQVSEIAAWIASQQSLSIEALRDYLEVQYGVVYQSRQSYYDLLQLGGLSYHKSEKKNPKGDAAQVLERRESIKKNWRSTQKK